MYQRNDHIYLIGNRLYYPGLCSSAQGLSFIVGALCFFGNQCCKLFFFFFYLTDSLFVLIDFLDKGGYSSSLPKDFKNKVAELIAKYTISLSR